MAYSYDRRDEPNTSLSSRGTSSYDRRRLVVADVSELKDRLAQLARLVRTIEEKEVLLDPDAADLRFNQLRIASFCKSIVETSGKYGAYRLFTGILQEYELNAKDRKIVERASKDLSRTKVIIKPEKAFEKYRTMLSDYREYLDVAQRVLSSGKTRSEGGSSILTVGSFQLVNTGGFDEATMQTSVKVVEKAEQLLRRKGLGKVCYGAIQITNTVYKSTRTLAFYDPKNDSVFIRSNLKGKAGPAIESVVHEFGHRLQHKFLPTKQQAINSIYRTIENKERELEYDKSKWPPIGSDFKGAKDVYTITGFGLNGRTEWIIKLQSKKDPKQTATIPLRSWLKTTGLSPFVTIYAGTSANENFAEMIRAYCLDALPGDQVEMLERVI